MKNPKLVAVISIVYLIALLGGALYFSSRKRVPKPIKRVPAKSQQLSRGPVTIDRAKKVSDSIIIDSIKAYKKRNKVDTLPYFADIDSVRYYFACGPCRDEFLKDPKDYIAEKEKKGARIPKRKLNKSSNNFVR